jgi:hypothetical protein
MFTVIAAVAVIVVIIDFSRQLFLMRRKWPGA